MMAYLFRLSSTGFTTTRAFLSYFLKNMSYADFRAAFAEKLKHQIGTLLTNTDVGAGFQPILPYGSIGRPDQIRLDACDQRYSELSDSLLKTLRRSVEGYIRYDETTEQYEERWAEERRERVDHMPTADQNICPNLYDHMRCSQVSMQSGLEPLT